MDTPLNIENKSDYTAGSKGKLYAKELMSLVKNIDNSIISIDSWKDIDEDKRLLFALSTAKHNDAFKTNGDGNDIEIVSSSIERFILRDKDVVRFVANLDNNDECTLKVDNLPKYPLLDSNGIKLEDGFIKAGHLQYAMFVEDEKVFKLINTNADADIVREELQGKIDETNSRVVSNQSFIVSEILDLHQNLLMEKERITKIREDLSNASISIFDKLNKLDTFVIELTEKYDKEIKDGDDSSKLFTVDSSIFLNEQILSVHRDLMLEKERITKLQRDLDIKTDDINKRIDDLDIKIINMSDIYNTKLDGIKSYIEDNKTIFLDDIKSVEESSKVFTVSSSLFVYELLLDLQNQIEVNRQNIQKLKD